MTGTGTFFGRAVALLLVAAVSCALGAGQALAEGREKPKVYFTKDISPQGILKLYRLINRDISGKVAVKVHTGEPGGPNIVPRDMVKALTDSMPGCVIVETNAYYGGPRQSTEGHREVLAVNGWDFAPVDIMDAEGSVNLPVPGGRWFTEVPMGKSLVQYDSMLVVTHFKGHSVGGFGGSLKNIALGCASAPEGKRQLHSTQGEQWGVRGEQFMEHMAESGKAVQAFFGPHMAYINVLRNMSVDCDCTGTNATPPTVPDLGILASTDLLAVDQASVDMVYALPEEVRKHLVERIESRSGLHQLEAMQQLGMGSREYELVVVD